MAPNVRFIRKNGKIIPIFKSMGTAKGATKVLKPTQQAYRAKRTIAGAAFQGGIKKQSIKVNHALDLIGLGTAVASGIVGAATFTGGAKSFITGLAVGHGLDAAGAAANIASVAGKDNKRERLKQGLKQEGRNLLVGNAVYAAGLLGMKKNREAIIAGGGKAVQYAKKILDFGRKALRVAA